MQGALAAIGDGLLVSGLMKIIVLVCSLVLSSVAIAQTPTTPTTVERQVKGKPDTNINAGIFTTIRNDCTAGPLPAVRLVAPPAHGKVTVKQGKLRATNVKSC